MIAKLATLQLFRQLERLEFGTLSLTTPDGIIRQFGGLGEGPTAEITLNRWSVIPNILRKGDIGFAEDYRDGHWTTPGLVPLLILSLKNRRALDQLVLGNRLFRLLSKLSYLARRNNLRGSRKNIEAHYDLGNEFYSLWLDKSMSYSAGLFNGDNNRSLEDAQQAKYDRVLDALDLAEDGSILEIGCGWGGLLERAKTRGHHHLKGITLSPSQQEYARHRLGDAADVEIEDYRETEGKYDGIVSIEMLEAVGEAYWPAYFKKIADLLKKEGKAVIQTITIDEQDFARYRQGGDFIRSFVFPGGMLPSLPRFQEEADRAGLKVEQPFFFGPDYAETLTRWLKAFEASKSELPRLGFDEKFVRLWRFYLSGCAAAFTTGRTNVMQATLTHK